MTTQPSRPSTPSAAPRPGEPIVRVSGLTAAYLSEDLRIEAVRNVRFDLYPGETLALAPAPRPSRSSRPRASLLEIGYW